jgi:ubiquinone biosynthesis protein COQ4
MDDGFTVERNWRRAAACWKGPVNPVKNHEEFLELVMALAGPSFQQAYDDFRADPDGQRLLAERPRIEDRLLDDAFLADCPGGSLGHAYRDFMSQNRLDAALYDQAHDLPAIGKRLGWDDDFYYVIHRGIILHDMLHVLGGYGPDIGGEIGVLAFTQGQAPNPASAVMLRAMAFAPIRMDRPRLRRFCREATTRGQRASILMAKPYEELLSESLDEVRTDLGVEPAELAHPEGMVYSDFQFGRRRNRASNAAFAPYEYDPERVQVDAA